MKLNKELSTKIFLKIVCLNMFLHKKKMVQRTTATCQISIWSKKFCDSIAFFLFFFFCVLFSSKISRKRIHASLVKVRIASEVSRFLRVNGVREANWIYVDFFSEHGRYKNSASPFTHSAASDLRESVVGYSQGEFKILC